MRKSKPGRYTRQIYTLFTPEEYEKLYKDFQATDFKFLNEYVRHRVFSKPYSVTYRNQSLVDLTEEVIGLKKALHDTGRSIDPSRQAECREKSAEIISLLEKILQLWSPLLKTHMESIASFNTTNKK